MIGAAFVSMFPALVNINPWLQEMVYGALSILAVTLLPGGVMSLLKRVAALGGDAAPETEPAVAAFGSCRGAGRGEPLSQVRQRKRRRRASRRS